MLQIFAWPTSVLRLEVLCLAPLLALLLPSSRIGAFLSELLTMTSFLTLKLPSAFGFRSSPFGRVNERVYAVNQAVVPPDSALAICSRRVFQILAVLAVNGSETLAGSKLHPPRFLRLVADATGEEAAGVSRLVVRLINR